MNPNAYLCSRPGLVNFISDWLFVDFSITRAYFTESPEYTVLASDSSEVSYAKCTEHHTQGRLTYTFVPKKLANKGQFTIHEF